MGSGQLGIAAGNKLALEAARDIAAAGGNAVDACLAAAVMAWVAEPFMASAGGSGFVAVRSPDGAVDIFDGNNAMPATSPSEPGQGMERIYLADYANGMYTGVGGGSVAVPGILAAIRLAWEQHGAIEWPALFEHAIKAAREGISFPHTSAYYLTATYREIWSRYPEARALLTKDGLLLVEGEALLQPELGDALEAIAAEGPDIFYRGELGREIIAAIQADGGFMTNEDLDSYEAKTRAPVSVEAFGWRIDSNPPPAVGGAVLTHMLALLEDSPLEDPVERLQAIIGAERVAMGYRKDNYEDPSAIASALEDALTRVRDRKAGSASTTHMSSADSNGYACSLTESNGYSSGMIVRGVFLNNTLGEEELNPRGAHGLLPGSRTHSNMTPTIATGPDGIVAIGSPGADRIVGAIVQTLIAIAVDEKSLADAVAAPRAHLAPREEGDLLCYEAGLPGDTLDYPTRPYDELHMFFGGVQVASVANDGSVDAAHDPRRSGGALVV